MNFIRASFIGALIGFTFAIIALWLYPVWTGEFPRTGVGVIAAFHTINWFGVWFLTVLFAVMWTLHEFRTIRAVSGACREFDFWRDLWCLLTFWRR
jgi:hypothetical protein